MLGIKFRQGTDQCAAVMPQTGVIMECPLGVEPDIHPAKINGKCESRYSHFSFSAARLPDSH